MIKDSSKLLIATRTGLTPSLTEYALKVATHLDLDIIILFVVETDPQVDLQQRRKLVERMSEQVEEDVATFSSLAWKSNVRVSVVVDVGELVETEKRLQTQDPAIRFILRDEYQTGNVQTVPCLSVVEQS